MSNRPAEADDWKKFVHDQKNSDDVPTTDQRDTTYDTESAIRRSDHEAINKILLRTLDPHLGKNEEQKRDFKGKLVSYIEKVLVAQLIAVGVMIIIVFLTICFDIPIMKDISGAQTVQMLEFLKYYITAIIAEFIAMLAFIVKFVFDKSIVDLTREIVKKD